jgi:hypothetical protein
MPVEYKLNAMQVGVLRWIADGSPPNVMDGYGYRVSAAALRSRGLIRISGRSSTWSARITRSGREYLGVADSQINPNADGLCTPAVRPAAPKRSATGGPGVALRADLRRAHPLVIATRDAAVGLRGGDDGRLMIGPRPGLAHMVIGVRCCAVPCL